MFNCKVGNSKKKEKEKVVPLPTWNFSFIHSCFFTFLSHKGLLSAEIDPSSYFLWLTCFSKSSLLLWLCYLHPLLLLRAVGMSRSALPSPLPQCGYCLIWLVLDSRDLMGFDLDFFFFLIFSVLCSFLRFFFSVINAFCRCIRRFLFIPFHDLV